MNRNQSTGTFYAFGAALALAASFVFSKSVLNQISMVHFGLIWFSMGVAWNGVWFLIRKEYRKLTGSFGRKTLVALLIAVLEGVATGLFYLAIKAMENPAVVSFIGNIGPVFVTLMGLSLLRERFRQRQFIGIVITILGIFVINYRQGGFVGFTDPGAIYVIGASFLFALATIAGRKYREYLNPGYMSLIRSLLLSIVLGILFFRQGGEGMFDLQASLWRDLLLGSLLETLIVIVFAYQALKMIEATKTSLIISSKGVWTLILAWAFLGVFPTGFQLLGGILTLAGVWLITWGKPLIRRG
ncbi:MAG: DMT family transporter [Bacteroidetes bacterium]|nr:DMT family transporter [Bacteroidota bacterium]